MGVLPENPFDGQVYIDAFKVQWVFDASVQCWRRIGAVNEIPLASLTTTGLLSKEDKARIDMIQEKGGGYGIIIRGLKLRSQSNPDGVLLGDVELVSNSLSIQCRDQDGREISSNCPNVTFRETDDVPPGFDINFSDNFLKSFCVEIAGGPGPIGITGKQGEKGDDGTGDGPVGPQGEPGIDYTTPHKFTGVKIIDVDQITDTAIVALEVDQEKGKLYVTKAKMNFPTGDDIIAKQLTAVQINRSIKFKGVCWDYDMIISPCGPADDYDVLDPLIAYYPSNFDPDKDISSYTPVRARLSDLVADMIAVYQKKLDDVINSYDEQIRTFIKEKDSEARQVLSSLGDRLSECENITYLDYCIGVQQGCDNVASDIVVVDETDPLCASIGDMLGCASLTCQVICCQEVYNKGTPVFAFEAPDPFLASQDLENQSNTTRICESLCWMLYGTNSNALGIAARGTVIPSKCVTYSPLPTPSGMNSYMNPAPPMVRPDTVGGPIQIATLANEFDVWANDLATRVSDGIVVYEKTQLTYQGSAEFPAGIYVIVYESGGVKQERLNVNERFGEPPNSDLLINGYFNDYFVGNEGNGTSLAPFFILNPYDHDKRVEVFAPIASTQIGLEVGVVPNTYQNLIPTDYFTVHAFNPYEFSGEGATDTPLSYVDPVGLDSNVVNNENMISWTPFPDASLPVHCELKDLQQHYLTGSLSGRSVVLTVTQPSFVFFRIRTAYTMTNFFGNLVMPPTLTPDYVPGLTKNYSYNRAIIYRQSSNRWPSINARPIALGKINMKVIKVECNSGSI